MDLFVGLSAVVMLAGLVGLAIWWYPHENSPFEREVGKNRFGGPKRF